MVGGTGSGPCLVAGSSITITRELVQCYEISHSKYCVHGHTDYFDGI
jgi:hypothetical protein